MPSVLATGFMAGLLEWARIELLRPHLDWRADQSPGTHVSFPHIAATLPGLAVTVDVKLESVKGRKLASVNMYLIDAERFRTKLTAQHPSPDASPG